MPSGANPRAQVAFKDSMIRGILQFTLRIAFRCVLHRCKSQDIRCRESFSFFRVPPCGGVSGGARSKSAPRPRRGGRFDPPGRRSDREEGTGRRTAPTPARAQAGTTTTAPLGDVHGSQGLHGCVTMILPQVHLRKPCYDFSFL